MKAVVLALLNQVMTYLCGRLWAVARAGADLYETRELTGAEKRHRVAVMVRDEATTIGLSVADSLINFAVEAAVQMIRSRQTTRN
jgi:hypothetical protein